MSYRQHRVRWASASYPGLPLKGGLGGLCNKKDSGHREDRKSVV